MFTSTPRDFDFPLVFKHYRLPISKGTNLLSLTNNDPFLKQINHGKGQIYIFASHYRVSILRLFNISYLCL